MGLQTDGGVLLAVGTSLANHSDCCCGPLNDPIGCSNCPDAFDGNDLIVTVSGLTNGDSPGGTVSCTGCASLNTSYLLSFVGWNGSNCSWSSGWIDFGQVCSSTPTNPAEEVSVDFLFTPCSGGNRFVQVDISMRPVGGSDYANGTWKKTLASTDPGTAAIEFDSGDNVSADPTIGCNNSSATISVALA